MRPTDLLEAHDSSAGGPMPRRIEPVAVAAHTLTCAAGQGCAALAHAVAGQRSGLAPDNFASPSLATWIGRVAGLEDAAAALPAPWRDWDCRATRLVWFALQADAFIDAVHAACTRFGASRVGLVLGTSASTIGASEAAYRALDADGGFPVGLRNERLNTPHALAAFVHAALGLEGPSLTVSTACSSSAKAFAVAERWLRLELADAVVVAGADALSHSLLFGFNALALLDSGPCRPFDAARGGLSVGEAAGFALLQRGPGRLQLLGHGESNDAHHMSSPHPQGAGAEAALDEALARAGLAAEDVDYLNLHGTGSRQNDEVEAALVARRFGERTHVSATKGLTGHTMGAAGIVEAGVCLLALEQGLLAGSPGTASIDPALGDGFAARLKLAPARRPAGVAVSHSFGFGGNNCVLVIGCG